MTAAAWKCLHCPESGTTTGTESGQDAKHVRATGHSTFTTTSPAFAERYLARAVGR